MERLAFFIISLAVITAVVQKFFLRSGLISYEEEYVLDERILVISIYDYGEDWEASVRQILNTSFYKSNIIVGVVIRCSKSNQKVNVPIDLQQNTSVTYVSMKNEKYISDTLNKMYSGEEYICIFRKSVPYNNWDVHCLDVLTDKRVITSLPTHQDIPLFPVIKNNKGLLVNGNAKQINSMSMTVTSGVCLCHNFIFGKSFTVKNIDFNNSMLEESFKINKKIVIPCFPLIKGKYIKTKSFFDKDKKYFENMSIGLSQYPSDNECILKYGSVDTANLQLEFQR